MKKVITVGVIIVLAVGFGYYLSTKSGPSTEVGTETFDLTQVKKVESPREIESGEHMLGNPQAKNTLVIYEDFACPACAAYVPTVKQIPDQLRDTRVVFRHFPLSIRGHENAPWGAYAAEAAGAQGKFWEMYEMLYQTQSSWTGLNNPIEKFVELATSAQVPNIEQFRSDLESKKYKPAVEKDVLEAYGLGLGGTPTLVFNGKILDSSQMGLASLKQAAESLYK